MQKICVTGDREEWPAMGHRAVGEFRAAIRDKKGPNCPGMIRPSGQVAERAVQPPAVRAEKDLDVPKLSGGCACRESACCREAQRQRLARDEFVAANPHCRQIVTPTIAKFGPRYDYSPLETLCQTLSTTSPRAPYVHRDDREKSLYCRSPLRLLLSDMHVLNQWTLASYGRPYTIVYVGAAPGHHIGYLARLYSACKFILYDCRAFVGNFPSNVTAVQQLFTTEVASDLAARLADSSSGLASEGGLVFISNIRSKGEKDTSEDDRARQREWATLLNPDVAALKFCLPWGEGRTQYLGGSILLQPFASQAGTVTRLVVTKFHDNECTYDNAVYEEQLAHHNMLGRPRAYEHDVELEGLDHCYDCSVFVSVFRSYFYKGCDGECVTMADGPAAIRRLMLNALVAINASLHGPAYRTTSFVSAAPRSDVRCWRT